MRGLLLLMVIVAVYGGVVGWIARGLHEAKRATERTER